MGNADETCLTENGWSDWVRLVLLSGKKKTLIILIIWASI